MESNNLKHLSMVWASGRNTLWDLVDFCVTKGITQDFTVVKSYFGSSSNHSPVLIILKTIALNEEK
jgi:hypothetical protein